METIAYTVGGTTTEISFEALGVGRQPYLTLNTHRSSTFTLPLPGTAPELAATIPFEAPCVIYTGRAYAAGVWSGGSILFQGRRVDNYGSVSGSSVSSELVMEDAWYDLRFLTMQGQWQVITGGTVVSPTYGTAVWPDIILFQATPGVSYSPAPVYSHITTGQAITEILNYAIAQGVNLQVGTLDPDLYVPFYPVRAVRCATAIQYALRPHPDCGCEIDYTTTPPTFNIRQRSSLTGITLPYGGSATAGGRKRTHLTSEVRPRPDLVPTRVGIYIKETSVVASRSVVSVGTDVYPAVSSGLRSLDVSLDITGPRSTQVTAQLTAAAFDPTNVAFWTTYVPALNAATHPETVASSLAVVNTAINDGSVNCITVLDNAGNPVDLTTYTNIMTSQGTAHSWMTLSGGGAVAVIEATVTGHLTYQRRKNIGTAGSPVWINVGRPNSHETPVKVKLTNSPAGTMTYTLNQLVNTGETYPTGLAAGIYNALSTLQYEFTHTILEQPFGTLIKPGKHALNLSGGASAWASMNAQVQSSTIKFIYLQGAGLTVAETMVKCGPVAHLEAGELVQIFNLFTHRDLNKISPAERAGLPNGGQTAAMPADTSKENTTPAAPDAGLQMFSALDASDTSKTNTILHDPANGQLVMNQRTNSSGAVNAAAPAITLAKADIVAAGTTNKAAKFQLVKLCDNTGTVRQAAILTTTPE